MRPAVAHGDAEPLGAAEDDVGAQLARRRQQRQAEDVGRDADQGLARPGDLGDRPHVAHLAARPRVLQEHAEEVLPVQLAVGIAHRDLDAERPGPGLDHGQGLRVAVAVDEEALGLVLGDPVRHGHGLGPGRRLVEQRGVGQLHPGQVHDHLLEVEQDLEPALADLGLVGRVGGVPARVLQNVPEDHRRRHRAVVAHADHRDEDPVAGRHAAQDRERHPLALGVLQLEGLGRADRRGYGLVDQRGQRRQAELGQHLLDLRLARPDVAADKVLLHLQIVQAPSRFRHVASLLRFWVRRFSFGAPAAVPGAGPVNPGRPRIPCRRPRPSAPRAAPDRPA